MPLLLVLFIGIPILEIYLFIKVGGLIGALPTVLCVIATAFAGAVLWRSQGMQAIQRFQQKIEQGEVPTDTMFEGVFLLVGGILLLTPGFFTDFIGLACLLPFTRQWMMRWVSSRVTVLGSAGMGFGAAGSSRRKSDSFIEGEIVERDEKTGRHNDDGA